jgi:iron complex outermembrane receptor protein
LKIDNNLALSSNKISKYTEFYDDYDTYIQKSNYYAKPDIAYSPSIVGGSSLEAKIIKNVEAKLISKYLGRQFLDNTSRKDRSLNAYFLQDLQLNYQFKTKELKSIQMILQINNIWNKLYEPNGYTYTYLYNNEISKNNYYYPMAGTNIIFAFNLNF